MIQKSGGKKNKPAKCVNNKTEKNEQHKKPLLNIHHAGCFHFHFSCSLSLINDDDKCQNEASQTFINTKRYDT